MGRSFIIMPLLFMSLLTHGQTLPRRGMFSLIGGYSFSNTLQQPQVTVVNGPYQLRPGKVNNPECYDENGRLVNCNGNGQQLSLGLLYRLSNKPLTAGWMLYANASMQQQVFTLNYPENRRFNIPVACTPSIRRLVQSTGASASIGRFWDVQNGNTQVFVRAGAMVAQGFQYLRGIYPTKLPDPTPTRYVSGGSGTLIEMYNQVPPYNWLLTSEIGLTTNDFPIELALSVHIPIYRPIVFSELHSFAENGRIVGQNRVDYTNSVFNLTARLGINLSKRNRKTPTSRSSSPQYPSTRNPLDITQTPSSPADPPSIHRTKPMMGRFDKPLNKPITLLVNFEQSKANLLPESHADLDQLIQWMKDNPNAEIRLEGHTDLIGDEQENLDLSRRRVLAVKQYISVRGIASYRIEMAYFGETRPLNRNCPPPNFCPENRRVEMFIKKR